MLCQKDFKVVDIHGHLPVKKCSSFIKRSKTGDAYHAEKSERMRLTWDFPHPSEEIDEQKAISLMDRWLAELDTYGVEVMNFLTAEDNDDMTERG